MNEQLALLSERLHHEAPAVPGPVQRLVTATAGTPTLWCMRAWCVKCTTRECSRLDPAKETLRGAGHTPPRHSEQAVLDAMSVRQEGLDQSGSADALAVLDLGDDVPRFEAEAMD
ncbi:hypothetical protein AB4039_37655 [Streptomyces sp. M-16]|uniref:hypothetical protein n=1 Tax=Streptomyces sp. M-16 TaxID=3233040 RepID=UPI003F9AA7FE